MKIFLNTKFWKKLRKEKTLIFENIPECQLQNAVEKWDLGIFMCGFWRPEEKDIKNPNVP